ncbi:MAG: nucleotidyl transferase AbiEii/AbiGii toxin family protein [Gammaproteobacteria bacterium]|nr:nucleotidyl transferase AbiEii/AbiGii toxin family protein [Gammaproteobacteria bacterium]
MLDRYLAQVRLLLGVLPVIARETAFALKGGTAINLFYRDLPRLSVDLDLTWLPVADRQSSLRDIDSALDRIAAAIAVGDSRRFPNHRSHSELNGPLVQLVTFENEIPLERHR